MFENFGLWLHYANQLMQAAYLDSVDCFQRMPCAHLTGAELYRETFSVGATCLSWVSSTLDPAGLTIAAGFQNGVFRVMRRAGQAEVYLMK